MTTAEIIPTLNEVEGMKKVVSKIKKEWVDEIIIVDGGSTDGTVEEAQNLGFEVIKQKTDGSHGAAIFDGFEYSNIIKQSNRKIDLIQKRLSIQSKSLDEIEGQYMGLMKFSAEGIKQIKGIFHAAVNNGELLGKDIENSYMTDLLQSVINSGQPITTIPVHGGWVEVDTVDDLFANITIDRIDRYCKL